MKKGQKTRHPGVYRLGDGRYRVEATLQLDGRRTKRRRVVEGSEGDAIRARLELLEEMQEEAPPEPSGIGSYALDWIERLAPRLKTSTRDHYRRTLAYRVLPQLGELQRDQVTRAHVAAWCTWAEGQRRPDGQPFSAATLNGWWRVLRQLLQDLAADVGISDPTLRVRPPGSERRDVRERRTLTADQVQKLLEAVAERWPGMHCECAVLAYTGIRDGELRALDCGDYRLVGDVPALVVARSVLHDGSIGTTKTGATRTVPVPPALQALLDAHLERLRSDGYLAVGSMPLFPGRRSARRSQGAHHAVLGKASEVIGLGWHAGPQVLRRTLNSRLRESAPGELVRAVLGHATEEMTQHYYEASLGVALKAVSEAMCATSGVPPKETPGVAAPGVSEEP